MFIFSKNRAGAVCAITGVLLLFIGTLLHPMQEDPNQAAAAFKEYAADHLWVASHLTQLAGVTLMVVSLLLLAARLRNSKGSTLAWIGAAAALVSLALAAVLQAIDGIALRNMVNAWASAAADQKDMLFQATFAVRKIEIGLASLFCLFGDYGLLVWRGFIQSPRLFKKLRWSCSCGWRIYLRRRHGDGLYRFF